MLKPAIIGAILLGATALATAAEPASPGTPLLIDVRTPQEYQTGHAPGAINIPYEEIAERITALTADHDTRILLYCRSGRRSGIATDALRQLGYRHVENRGGLAQVMARVSSAP